MSDVFNGLPKTWEILPLSAFIAHLESGVSVNADDRTIVNNEIGVLSTSCAALGRFMPEEHKAVWPNEFNRVRVNPRAGEIIISRMNTPNLVGETGLVKKTEPSLFLPDRLWQTVARVNKETDFRWLNQVLQWEPIRKAVRDVATGTSNSMKNISKGAFLAVQVPTPPINEQRGIAEVSTALDEQIEQTELEKAKLARVITGAFDDVFGAGLVGDTSLANIKNGALLSGWARVTVSQASPEIVDFRGRTPLKLGMRWGGGDIQALSANNVEMGRINLEKETYFASDALYERWMTKGACAKDDIVMTLEAPLGNIALVPDDRKYILSQRVVLLKPNKAILPGRYLYLYLRWRWFQQLLVEESTGTTATGIQRKKLEKLPVLVAPQKELDSITNFLLSLLVQMDDFDAELKKLCLQKQGLMHDLLTGATRVR